MINKKLLRELLRADMKINPNIVYVGDSSLRKIFVGYREMKLEELVSFTRKKSRLEKINDFIKKL